MYWNTGKLNLFLFFWLDTCLKKREGNETLTAAETTQSLASEDYPLKSRIENLKNQSTICSSDVSRI